MRHHAESYESQAEGRSADDFEFLMDLSGLVTAWADALSGGDGMSLQAIRLDAAMAALESMTAQGYFLHDAKGCVLDRDTTLRAIITALDTAAPPPQVGSKLEEPLQELADLEAEMRAYVCWGRPKMSVWLDRLAAIREALGGSV